MANSTPFLTNATPQKYVVLSKEVAIALNDKQASRSTNGQTDRQTDRQIDKQTDKQTYADNTYSFYALSF